MLTGSELTNATVTCCCSFLSLLGSLLIITSYLVARTRSTPKSAFLILHLATSDFFWFLSSSIMSILWLANQGSVPDVVCHIVSPVIEFTRMTSLIWTVVISYNVLMSVRKRKWFWKSQESDWELYRKMYFGLIFLLASPGTIFKIIKQFTTTESLGCLPGYEPIGVWYEVLFTELLPMTIGFFCNLYVFCNVRHKMSKTAFPLSVRKRRKRVMYHYIIVCILCWIPTIWLYILEIAGYHSATFDIIARTSLYASGLLNFLVFGMQDPHLKRSFDVMLFYSGLASLCGMRYTQVLKETDVDKSVMFREETILLNADKAKDKMNVYRNRKLSREDKQALYKDRPDLDPRYRPARYRPPRKQSTTAIDAVSSSSSSSGLDRVPATSGGEGEEEGDEDGLHTPLLSAGHASEAFEKSDGDVEQGSSSREGGDESIVFVEDEDFLAGNRVQNAKKTSNPGNNKNNSGNSNGNSAEHDLSLLSFVSNQQDDGDTGHAGGKANAATFDNTYDNSDSDDDNHNNSNSPEKQKQRQDSVNLRKNHFQMQRQRMNKSGANNGNTDPDHVDLEDNESQHRSDDDSSSEDEIDQEDEALLSVYQQFSSS